MTMPPRPERDLPVRDGDDVRRLRVELDRLVTENAALRAALATAPVHDSVTVRALVRRRWIGGVASVLLLVLGIAVGVWYAQYIGPGMVRGFREGWSEGSQFEHQPPAGSPAAAPPPTAPAPAPAPAAGTSAPRR